jgi:PEP-CTERM motif
VCGSVVGGGITDLKDVQSGWEETLEIGQGERERCERRQALEVDGQRVFERSDAVREAFSTQDNGKLFRRMIDMKKNLSTMLRAGALAALFVVGSSAAAFAAPIVSFTTSGSFNGGIGTIVFTDGDGTNARLTFNPSGLQNLDAPSNVQYGDMLLTVFTPGADGIFNGDISGTTFDLTVTQTAPSAGGALVAATLQGTLAKANQTDFALSFGPGALTFFSIGNVEYSIQSNYFLVPPVSGSTAGTTTLQGQLKAVPEPTTMMLLGTGLLAAFRARRKTTTV